MAALSGVVPMLVTPFLPDGSLEEPALRRQDLAARRKKLGVVSIFAAPASQPVALHLRLTDTPSSCYDDL
ncbi:MAG: dihydrodipicolinate synthase family protein [Chloroflexi bacterium]|nr:dihydrodipicolinate synthase family protein [Chloroflexota bacterium]